MHKARKRIGWWLLLLSIGLPVAILYLLPERPTSVLFGHGEYVTSIAIAPDARTAATASADRTVRLWSLESRKTINILGPFSKTVEVVTFSPDGTLLAIASGIAKNVLGADRYSEDGDSKIKIYDTTKGTILKELFGHDWDVLCLAFSPDGSLLASSDSGRSLILWDSTSWEQRSSMRVTFGAITGIGFVGNGEHLVVATRDGSLICYDTRNHGIVWSNSCAHTEPITCLASSPNGPFLATGSHDGTARVWHSASGSLFAVFESGQSVSSMSFSGDGSLLAVSDYPPGIHVPILEAGHVRIWDIEAKKLVKSYRGQHKGIRAVALSKDAGTLLSGDFTGSVSIWSLRR